MLPPGAGRVIAGGGLHATLKVPGGNPAVASTFEVVVPPGFDVGAHVHRAGQELFYVLEGSGTLHVDERALPLEAGMVAAVGPSEVHWFENPSDREFSFVEFWSPPPTETVWVRDDDI